MEISKSSRHQKIIGDYGENLVCNFLSRSGWEVIIVDHTGIDIIAYNPSTKRRLGITVKSRTRNRGKEEEAVNILSYQKEKNDRKKLLDACRAFDCDPWIAVYVETLKSADVYLTSLKNYDKKYKNKTGVKIDTWKMGKKDKERYLKDNEVKHIKIEFQGKNWD